MSAAGGFEEPRPDLILPNPGGPADPLGESALDSALPWLRVFEPRDVRVVIGRHQDPEREVLVEACRADGVPIHRRVAGGGTVVLAPGMAVVAVRLANTRTGTTCWFDLINQALAPAVEAVAGERPLCRGHGDLCLAHPDGHARKILGASQRQTARLVLYLGVFLVADAVPLMERYLRPPSREPDYRGGRDHRAFCTHLGTRGVAVPDLIASLERECRQRLADQALIG
ncbi:MAG: hypothetical protein L6R48_10955 [Planctomycetes bacterium]|nr:hypothetical protein [Planctomycetota bacterium]